MTKKKKALIFWVLLIVLIFCISSVLFIFYKGKGIVVLMYHGVDNKNNEFTILKDDFEEQMKYLANHNYETIFVEDIYKDHKGKKTIALTFDDGYENFYDNVFPLLKKYNLKANLYIITSAIGKDKYLTESEIKEMSDSSLVSIGSHTENHVPLTYFGEKDIINELQFSKQKLEKITGNEIKIISYPNGNYDDYIIALTKYYYEFALNTKAKTNFMKHEHKPYEINRYGIGSDTTMNEFKKVIFHSSIFRF